VRGARARPAKHPGLGFAALSGARSIRSIPAHYL
jgi:hypothetical protein